MEPGDFCADKETYAWKFLDGFRYDFVGNNILLIDGPLLLINTTIVEPYEVGKNNVKNSSIDKYFYDILLYLQIFTTAQRCNENFENCIKLPTIKREKREKFAHLFHQVNPCGRSL